MRLQVELETLFKNKVEKVSLKGDFGLQDNDIRTPANIQFHEMKCVM